MPCVAFCGATVLQHKETETLLIWIDQTGVELLWAVMDIVVDGVSLQSIFSQRRI